jgi:hypothetical protein
MIRKPLITVTAIILLLAGTMRGQQALAPEPSPTPQTYPLAEPTPLSITSPSSSPPRMHRFTDQPVGTVLRVLAEQAGMNCVEPNLNPDEHISIYLRAMTPIQAFYAVAAARGFKVLYMRNANTMTLERSESSVAFKSSKEAKKRKTQK